MKKGITVAMLVVIVSVIGILTTATIKSISNSYTNAKLSVWITEVELVQDLMNENKNNVSDMLLDEVIWDLSKLDDEARTEQIKGETIADDKVVLKEINLSALGVDNALYGIQPSKLDVYAYSEKTGKVYYLKGIKVGTKRYYTLTSDLKNRFGDNLTTSNLSLITFEQSEVNNTENAVKATVKVPKAFTNVTVTTSNAEIQVSAPEVKEDKIVYIVNTNEIKANYDITVTYIDNGAEKTVAHSVNNLQLTLGELINNAEDYGKTIDYSVIVNDTVYDSWKIYYHTEEYVYIKSMKSADNTTLAEGLLVESLTNKEKELYEIFRLNDENAYVLVDNIDGSVAHNSQGVVQLIKNYAKYANIKKYGSYVVGAIGGPTLELLVAGWNAKKYEPELVITTTNNGYKVNDTSGITLTQDGFYVDTSRYWLASPAANTNEAILRVGMR